MQVTQNLLDYLHTCAITTNNEIILADLEKVLIANASNNDIFKDKTLSGEIKKLGRNWTLDKEFTNNYFFANNAECIKLINNDNISYTAQLVFPIYHNNSLDGYLIFFRQVGNYISSSCKAPISCRKFVEIMSTNDIN